MKEVQTIEEEAKNLGLKLQISLQWTDARVQFYNLKHDEHKNSLTQDEQQDIWTPTIVFRNTRERMSMMREHLQESEEKQMDQ